MKFRGNKMLGLAIGERSILVAEVSTADGKCQVTHAGAFGYTDGTTLQQPEALGEALAQFLKQQGFTAKAAVFGIPAKWVLTKSKELPPVDPALAADVLRLQVESEFSAEIKDLVHDYAGQSDANAPSRVLLAATPIKHVEQVQAIAAAAKLDIQGITPTAVVLSAATSGGAGEALVLSITPSGTELAGQQGASPSLLRHVGSTAAVTANVAGEVRRASLLLPRHGVASGNGSANSNGQGQVVVWDDGIFDPAARRAAMDALGPVARSGQFSSLGAGEAPAGTPNCAAAVALAVAGFGEASLAIDFFHPRLAAPKKPAMERRTVLAIAAGAALALAMIFAYIDLHSRENVRAEKYAELKRSEKTRENAATYVATIEFAKSWHAGNPRYLDCLRDLTHDVSPDSGIFVTSFTMHDSMKGEIGGKSTEKTDKSVRDLADRLRTRADKRFQDVDLKSVDKRQIRAGQEISFSITFRYVPAEPSQP